MKLQVVFATGNPLEYDTRCHGCRPEAKVYPLASAHDIARKVLRGRCEQMHRLRSHGNGSTTRIAGQNSTPREDVDTWLLTMVANDIDVWVSAPHDSRRQRYLRPAPPATQSNPDWKEVSQNALYPGIKSHCRRVETRPLVLPQLQSKVLLKSSPVRVGLGVIVSPPVRRCTPRRGPPPPGPFHAPSTMASAPSPPLLIKLPTHTHTIHTKVTTSRRGFTH